MKKNLIILLIISCSNEMTLESCDALMSKVSKGNTTLYNKWQKSCSHIEGVITLEECKMAYNDLLTNGSQALIEKKYGPKAMNCFTDKDKNKFLIKDEKDE